MPEFMYDKSSVLIAVILFLSMALVMELGYRLGRGSRQSELSKAQVNAVQGSLLGVLALLLGFTFSLSLQRYDGRSAAVVAEANAIGTAWLRAQMLPEAIRGRVREALAAYLDQRLAAGKVSLDHAEERREMLAKTTAQQDLLWTLAREAVTLDDRPVTSGLFVQALNDMIDAFGTRDAALNRHVPEVVLLLLYGTFLMCGGVVGYASGLGNHRAPAATYVMVGLIVLLVFLIVDLDRPRRGLIEVSQQSLVELRKSMAAAEAPQPGAL